MFLRQLICAVQSRIVAAKIMIQFKPIIKDSDNVRRIALQIEERSAIKQFIMNLRKEIGSQVRPLKPDNIQKSQHETLETETWLREKNRFRQNPSLRSALQTSQNLAQFLKSRIAPQSASNPVLQNNSSRFRPNFRNLTNQNRPPQVQCNNCKAFGHVESQCYRKQKQNFPTTTQLIRPPQRVHYTTETPSLQDHIEEEIELP